MITYPPDIAFFALSVERLHGVSAGDTACGSDALPPSSLALIVAAKFGPVFAAIYRAESWR
jgi:hypothetical protein